MNTHMVENGVIRLKWLSLSQIISWSFFSVRMSILLRMMKFISSNADLFGLILRQYAETWMGSTVHINHFEIGMIATVVTVHNTRIGDKVNLHLPLFFFITKITLILLIIGLWTYAIHSTIAMVMFFISFHSFRRIKTSKYNSYKKSSTFLEKCFLFLLLLLLFEHF